MKVRASLLAIPLIVGVAVAQSTSGQSGQSGQTQGSSGQQQQSGSQSGSAAGQAAQSGSTTSTQAGSQDSPAMMKTQTYRGVLVDLACGSGGSGTASAAGSAAGGSAAGASTAGGSTAGAPTAGGSTAGSTAGSQAGSTGSASRSASGDCPVTANSTQLGLKMDNGQVVRFDLVGNQRAQDQLKTNKGWNKNITNNKPVKVKISGVLQGDKLIVSSIN